MAVDKLFTYFGNKQRIAKVCWDIFGPTKAYVEPFCGCASMLLASPYEHTFEAINDADCYVVNAFRAVKYHHEAVIEHLYNPRFEIDLHARHDYLVNHKHEFTLEMMRSDPKFCDPELAAWWIWGINLWIGSNWCSVNHTIKGQSWSKKPVAYNQGVLTSSKKPVAGNKGVLNKGNRRDIIDSMVSAVFDRLVDVSILHGDFERLLTPSYTTKFGSTAVFLDPPYMADYECYEADDKDGSVWDRAKQWVIDNHTNKDLRIILCGELKQWPDSPLRVLDWKRGAGYNKDRSEDNRSECVWTNVPLNEGA